MKVCVAGLVLLLALSAALAENCKDDEVLDMTSDAYHWPTMKPVILDASYREWWFFIAYDTASDLAMCFSYSVHDPGKYFKKESSGLSAMLWPDVMKYPTQIPIAVVEQHPFSDFSGTTANATVRVGDGNTIEVISPTVYHAKGRSKDRTVAWDLQYEQKTYACGKRQDFPGIMQIDWES